MPLMRDTQMLPTNVVARLARTNRKGVANLHSRGFVLAQHTPNTRGSSLGYTFAGTVAARVAADFARSGGALKDIRGLLVHLANSKKLGTDVPKGYIVVTDGTTVFFEGAGPFESPPGKWLRVIPIGVIVAEVRADLAKLAEEEENAA